MMDPMNPATSGGLFSVYGMMQKIDLPGITGQNKSLTCYTTGKGSSKCFELSTSNAVKCKGNSCFVAYQTFNQRIIGAASGIKRLGLDALMIPNGLSTRVILAGEIDLEVLQSMDDDDARQSLMEVRGIGAWTADTYLLFALRRADAWPSGDLALAKAIQELRGFATKPGPEEVDGMADHWRPWRAVAARILWHHYLCKRGRSAPSPTTR